METLRLIVTNKILVTAFLGYFIAQIIKAIIEGIMDHTFSFRRLMSGNGGIPSSHASTVCALATMTAFTAGVASFEFAIAVVFAIVVMVDASGVRRETGNQAIILNELMEYFAKLKDNPPRFSQDKLKELIGHTPLQVQVGAALGIIIAVVTHFIWR
ncbi:MAG: divergent PAP2 family protein [Lachnospiraceae bacterium]|nr:divergent PAP2 family protein [Lachnospiraceae bacterium]